MTDFSYLYRNQTIVWSVIFLVIIALGAVGYTTIWGNNLAEATTTPSEPTYGLSPGLGATATLALSSEEKAMCGITKNVSEGPYYVSGTRKLTNGNLNYTNLPGTLIKITGHVYEDLGTSTPLKDTMIEFWEADQSGNYHPASSGKASDYDEADIALRGYVMTDADGAYVVTALYPGAESGRMRNISVKVNAPNKPTLTSELALPALLGDEVTFDNDSIGEQLPNCQLLTVSTTTKPYRATFDFHLPK